MRTNESALDQKEVERQSDWLWSFLVEYTGEDRYFDPLLGRSGGIHPPHPQDVFERDRLAMFREVVDYLIELLGSEAAAANWLFHNPVFQKIVGASPFDYLESGEFHALSLLHDWLQIACFGEGQRIGTSDAIFGAFKATAVSE